MPNDFYLYLKLKAFLIIRKFTDEEDVICIANSRLEEEELYNGIHALEYRWTTCIAVCRRLLKKYKK